MPRISQSGTSRAVYYDRNPVIKPNAYAAESVVPHAATVRWTYTVTTGKKGYLQSALTHIERDAAATVTGRAVIKVRYSQDAGATFFNIALAVLETLTAGEKDSMVFAGAGLLASADQLSCITADNSTNGTVYYEGAAIAAEFDA